MQTVEVIEYLHRKDKLQYEEVYGTTTQVPDVEYLKENGIWLLKELLQTLTEKKGVIVTLENEKHSIAVLCSKTFLGKESSQPTFWLFDPLVASLTSCADPSDCAAKIERRAGGRGTIFTAVVFNLA